MNTPSPRPEYEQAIELLTQSGEYRVIEKYRKPDFYNKEDDSAAPKKRGIFLDVESTGGDYKQDKIIELEKDYEVEIEANGIFKLRSEGLVIAPFADLDELCRFIKMG